MSELTERERAGGTGSAGAGSNGHGDANSGDTLSNANSGWQRNAHGDSGRISYTDAEPRASPISQPRDSFARSGRR